LLVAYELTFGGTAVRRPAADAKCDWRGARDQPALAQLIPWYEPGARHQRGVPMCTAFTNL